MATRKTPAKKTTSAAGRTPAKSSAKTSTAKRTAARTTATKTRTTTRRTTRRTTPALSTTLGSALGTLLVTTLLDLSWPVRIGLLLLVLALGVGYLLWRARSEIASAASSPDGGVPAGTQPVAPLTEGTPGDTGGGTTPPAASPPVDPTR